MPIKHEASRVLYWHQGSMLRASFGVYQELGHALTVSKNYPKHLDKAYLFQSIGFPSTFSSQVRQCWTVSSANTSVRRLILAILTYFGYISSCYINFGYIDMSSFFIVYIMFFTPYHAILQYSTPDVLSVLPYNGKFLNRLILKKVVC